MVLAQKDFDQIEELVREIIDEQAKHLPSKEEFFSTMDKVMKELEAIRQELVLTNHHLSDHEDRISSLEEIHPQGQHLPLGV